MTDPHGLTSPEGALGLTRSRTEVAELLGQRIGLGHEINGRSIQTVDDLAAYGSDSKKWMEYNYDLLRTLFTNDTVAREYRTAIPQFLVTRDDRLNFRNSQKKTIHQLTKLESILERLEFYPEPGGDVTRRVRSDGRDKMDELRFSRRTVIAAAEVMEGELETHADLTRQLLKLDPWLAERCKNGTLTDRFNRLIQTFDEEPNYRLDDGEPLWGKFVETAVALLRPPRERFSFEDDAGTETEVQTLDGAFRRALEVDGFVVSGKTLHRALPVDVELPAAQSEVDRLLAKHGFATAIGHLKEALDAHGRGGWAAANSQIRTFLDALLDDMAIKLDPTAANLGSGQPRRTRLAAQGFLNRELNEWDDNGLGFINGLTKRLHPKGSHPGLSDEEDSTFRLHVVLLTARLLLTRLDTWGRA